ncbi:MAG TPA: hypothetical protein VI685_13940 [Candidatus Angelobacter sp.]
MWKQKPKHDSPVAIGTLLAGVIVATIYFFQLSTMQQTLHIEQHSQRAWLQLSSKLNEIVKEQKITRSELLDKMDTIVLPAIISNSGKTPAISIKVDIVLEIIRNGEDPPFDYSKRHTVEIWGILFPGERHEFPVIAYRRDGSEAVLTEDERQGLRNGQLFIRKYGRITYEDRFGQHWTQYCVWMPFAAGNYTSSSCTPYNQVDTD